MFYLASRLISITTGFLFPAYSSYKAIRANDSANIEHWLMYWVVMSCLHVAENTVEWTINWFPFYYEAKSIVILWLTLPQIQGSTYIYLSFVEPFLATHEHEIDGTIAKTKLQARAAGLDYARRAWLAIREMVMHALLAPEGGQAINANVAPRQPIEAAGEPSAAHDAASAPTQQAWTYANTLIKQYAPAAIAAGQAFIKPLSPERSKALVRDHAARRKKDDDLPETRQAATTGASGRPRYPSELGRGAALPRGLGEEGQRRVASASAALVGATGGHASGSRYSSYTRQQLRQRRLELEQELAALEYNTTGPLDESFASAATLTASSTPARRPPSPLDSIRAGPPTPQDRERHISAPTPPRSSSYANIMSASSSYEKIARDEVEDAELPNDWGRNVASNGWKGAPKGGDASGSARPANEKRSSWFGWGGGSSQAVASSDQGTPVRGAQSVGKGKKAD